MVPADSDRVSRAPPYLGATKTRIAFLPTGLSPSMAALSRALRLMLSYHFCSSTRHPLAWLPGRLSGPATPPSPKFGWFRLFRFRSPLLAESRLFSLPRGTKMVHFPPFAPYGYVFTVRYQVYTPDGFPHSEIPGSQNVCFSPRLIAACHVLHRLLVPRHPHVCP